MANVYSDAGHGGSDPGAVDGKQNDALYTMEKSLALDVSLKYGAAMQRCKQAVKQSRAGDTYPSLTARSAAANAWPATIFVSHHMNAHYDGSPARGIEVLYYPTSVKGKALAQAIYDAMAPVSPWADRGLKARDNLHVLKATKMPAVIIEYGFITNTEEEKALNSPAYRLALAEAAARGTCKYLGIPYVAAAPAPKPPAPAPAPAGLWRIAEQTASRIVLTK